MSSYSGIGVSPGVVVGPVRKIVQVALTEPIPASPKDIFAALEQVALDLESKAHHIELEIANFLICFDELSCFADTIKLHLIDGCSL